MARKKLVENELGLDVLIPQYGDNNTELKYYKKICKEQGDKIKELFRNDDSLLTEDGKREKTVGNYTATVSIRENESWNMDKLLELIKTNADKKIQKAVIRQKEYIDEDEIEKLIYNGSISKELLMKMDTCRTSDPVEVLTVKSKEAKNGGKKS